MEILVLGVLIILAALVLYRRGGGSSRGIPYGRGKRDAGDGDRGGWVGGNVGGGDAFGGGGSGD